MLIWLLAVYRGNGVADRRIVVVDCIPCRVCCWLYTEVMVLLTEELLLLTVHGVDLVAGCIQR